MTGMNKPQKYLLILSHIYISYISYSYCRKTREEQKDKIKSTVEGNCIGLKKENMKKRG
jgi:hypothetical protein